MFFDFSSSYASMSIIQRDYCPTMTTSQSSRRPSLAQRRRSPKTRKKWRERLKVNSKTSLDRTPQYFHYDLVDEG